MDNKTLTVFTCTYNRAHTIYRTYESLLRQSCKDFRWLIIDDGSTDNTRDIVSEWLNRENGFAIRYVWKENGGLHTGYNKAIELMNTELGICIDSDDWMPDDAVENIISLWKEKGNKNVAGIVGLDFFESGKPIGGYFKGNAETVRNIDLGKVCGHYGDVKQVYRVELLKKVAPMPTFEGEKNFNPVYLFLQVDEKYPLLVLNKNLCFVEYQPDGMAANIFKQYINSPKSFAQLRRLYMSLSNTSWSFRFRNAIHYVSSCIFSGEQGWIKSSGYPIMTTLAFPLGLILNIYIRYKAK